MARCKWQSFLWWINNIDNFAFPDPWWAALLCLGKLSLYISLLPTEHLMFCQYFLFVLLLGFSMKRFDDKWINLHILSFMNLWCLFSECSSVNLFKYLNISFYPHVFAIETYHLYPSSSNTVTISTQMKITSKFIIQWKQR